MHQKKLWRLLAALAIATTASAQINIPLTVEDRAGTGQENAFICSGLPFARGVLKSATLALVDNSGTALPACLRSMERWDDGSVKWLQIQTALSLAKGEQKKLALKTGNGPAVKDDWHVQEGTNGVRAGNGLLELALAQSGTEPVRGLWVKGMPVFQADGEPQMLFDVDQTKPGPTDEENWLRDAAPTGELLKSHGKVEACYVEEKTPFRLVICQEGAIVHEESGERMASFVLRYYLYKGSYEVKLEHTVVLEFDTTGRFLRLCALRFPANLEGTSASFSGADAADFIPLGKTNGASLLATKDDARVHQVKRADVKPVRCWIERGASEQRKKTQDCPGAAGWVNIKGPKINFTMGGQRFKQRFPKELAATGKGIVYSLWPSSTQQVLDTRNYRWGHQPQGPEGKRWEALQGRAEGTAMTERMLFDFSGKARGDILLARHAQRLLLKADPHQYLKSGVFGTVSAYNPQKFPEYEGAMEALLYWIIRSPDEFQWYGLLNDGGSLMEFNWAAVRGWPQVPNTWMCRGYSGWLMDDGNPSQMMLLCFLRSGNDDYFDFVERKMNYVNDIACVHADTEPLVYASNNGRPCIGGSRRHNAQPWGDYISSRGANAYGKYFFYLLTGEPRYFDVIVEGLYFEWIYWSYENWTMVGSLSLGYELFKGLQESDPYFEAKHKQRLARLQRMKDAAQKKNWGKCVQAANFYLDIEKQLDKPEVLLNRATELLKTKVKAETLDFVAECPMTEGVKYYELAQAPDSPNAQYARKFLQTAADEVLAGRGAGPQDQYAPLFQGRAMVMANAIKPDPKYRKFVQARLDEMFGKDKASLNPVSLAGDMQGGAAALSYMELWKRIARYDGIPCQKLEHVNGRVLARMPYFLYCLESR